MNALLEFYWLKPTWLLPYSYGITLPLYELLLGALVLFLLRALVWRLFPKVAVIAGTTAKEVIFQPLFPLVLVCGSFLLLLLALLPYYTFGDDIKVLQDNGLRCLMALTFLLGLWTGSTSIADDLEQQTAMTVLSKPISRVHYLVGKLLGILAPQAVLLLILGQVFLLVILFKINLDMRTEMPDNLSKFTEMTRVLPGLVACFLEAATLTAISVALSTRLPMLANMMICVSIYALGHLAPLLVEDTETFAVVRFVGQLIAVVLPNLQAFDMQAAMTAEHDVPLDYLGWSVVYCVLYITAVMILALLLFEDRDLA